MKRLSLDHYENDLARCAEEIAEAHRRVGMKPPTGVVAKSLAGTKYAKLLARHPDQVERGLYLIMGLFEEYSVAEAVLEAALLIVHSSSKQTAAGSGAQAESRHLSGRAQG